mgnify:CR=1 FL=1
MMNKMRKMKNKKGFTLMEMLIVVAIIAILIAIAIPTFASSLNKARVATDEANIRSGYASVMAQVLTDDKLDVEGNGTGKVTFWLNKDGSVLKADAADATTAYTCMGKPDDAKEIGGQSVNAWKKGDKVKYEYNYSNNKITIFTVA